MSGRQACVATQTGAYAIEEGGGGSKKGRRRGTGTGNTNIHIHPCTHTHIHTQVLGRHAFYLGHGDNNNGTLYLILEQCPTTHNLSCSNHCESPSRTRLVKSNVSIGSDPGHEKVNSACSFDLPFVFIAFSYKVWCIAVQNMNILWVDVNMLNVD